MPTYQSGGLATALLNGTSRALIAGSERNTLDETFTNLASFLNSLDAEGEQKFELSHSLVIICPDCGKNIAFRGRCPKCAGNSWIPAGNAGGIFERMKAQRLRKMIGEDEVSESQSLRVSEETEQAG